MADAALVDAAVDTARALLVEALAGETRAERRHRRRLGRLLADPASRELVVGLTDRVLRMPTRRAKSSTFRELVRRHGTAGFGTLDRLQLVAGSRVAPLLPAIVMPLVERRIRAHTSGIVVSAADPALARHLADRRAAGFQPIVNPLGEAVLSDAEADRRLGVLLDTIARSDVDDVSCKVSALVANLDVLAFDASVERIVVALRTVFRAAGSHTRVNVDMEEYRDLELTLTAFTAVLDEPEFAATAAGIVLQAYLPDAHDAASRLVDWARRRAARDPTARPIRVRLVKGANLAMELVEAELHGWCAAPYAGKDAVDASYKRLLDVLFDAARASLIEVGVASHNLFDVAWALTVSAARGVSNRTTIEMLEGMAPAQARAVRARAPVRLYTPVVADADFVAALAYLARRLDENTQPGNFLRALFTLDPDGPEFTAQAERFRAAVAARDRVDVDRRRRRCVAEARRDRREEFVNEPDSDFTDQATRQRVLQALTVQLSAPRVVPERMTSVEALDAVVANAALAGDRVPPLGQRREWLLAAADVMREHRFEIIAAMAHETAKTVREGDPEVSEAIDFCEYSGREGIARLAELERGGHHVRGRGVVAVVAPWNFPYAIPAGGVAAALAAGNAVVLKPAPEAVAVGALLAEHFWRAGVPRDRLFLVVCDDDHVGRALVTHPRLDTVVLTGSLATASRFLEWTPRRRLLAETSGKNALVITAAADLDLAIADLVRSAFGHAGQKCSAASLAIVDRAVYDGPTFLPRLRDAVTSLRVGEATDVATEMGPLIGPPNGSLRRALTTLEPGEEWLVTPRQLDDVSGSGRLWSPGVRIGVRPGSWFHLEECFGPVLGVLRADDLDHAIDLQNATPFGLTGGLHSLDPAEVERWCARVEVGNAYVNRGTTGAVVRRQPFGGWKRSRVGGGAKAGGPGQVLQLTRVHDGTRREDRAAVVARAADAYAAAWEREFAVPHDPSELVAESNVLRYLPLRAVAVRHDGTDPLHLELCRTAARVAGVALVESDARVEDDAAFVMRARDVDRVLLLVAVTDDVRRALHRLHVTVDDDPPVTAADVEMRRWVVEQSITITTHRHGRVACDHDGRLRCDR